jgi:hypothetical protein
MTKKVKRTFRIASISKGTFRCHNMSYLVWLLMVQKTVIFAKKTSITFFSKLRVNTLILIHESQKSFYPCFLLAILAKQTERID